MSTKGYEIDGHSIPETQVRVDGFFEPTEDISQVVNKETGGDFSLRSWTDRSYSVIDATTPSCSMNKSAVLITTLAVAILGSATGAWAQRPNLSAREALGLVSSQFGPESVRWVAEMRAQGGVPQPSDWQLLAYDQRAPKLLYRFWAGGGRAGDGGVDDQRYPDDVPVGYFSLSQISVDSVAAFTIAEGQARQAKMAFDSCDYLLRLREFSREPVWRLELLDGSRQIVGKLYISAATGEVLRTVWVYRDSRARPDGQPLIVDSMAPAGTSAPTDLSGGGYPSSMIAPGAVIPPMPPGIITGQVPGQVPGSMSGIHSVPLPSAPGVAVAGSQPYAPVDSSGRTMTPPSAPNNGIPSPPPVTRSTPPPPAPGIPAPPPATSPYPSASGSTSPSAPPAPVKPTSGGGDAERIPPPPIP